MAIVYNQQQLMELAEGIPYPTFCIIPPDQIIYPAVVKPVLIDQKHIIDGAEYTGIVYMVPFDTNDILSFYEVVASQIERAGIEGYEYAESEEANQGTGTATQEQDAELHQQTFDDNVWPPFISDNDPRYSPSKAGGSTE